MMTGTGYARSRRDKEEEETREEVPTQKRELKPEKPAVDTGVEEKKHPEPERPTEEAKPVEVAKSKARRLLRRVEPKKEPAKKPKKEPAKEPKKEPAKEPKKVARPKPAKKTKTNTKAKKE